MIKILDQSNRQLFSLEGNNIFIDKNKILISGNVNKFSGNTALLGEYNDEEEALMEFVDFTMWLEDTEDLDKTVKIYVFGKKEEEEEQEDEGK